MVYSNRHTSTHRHIWDFPFGCYYSVFPRLWVICTLIVPTGSGLGVWTHLNLISTTRKLQMHILVPNNVISKFIANCDLYPDQRNGKNKNKDTLEKNENWNLYILPTWGVAPFEPISTNYCNSFRLTDVINHSQFSIDWCRRFSTPQWCNVCPLP